jgi:hypothetical protein
VNPLTQRRVDRNQSLKRLSQTEDGIAFLVWIRRLARQDETSMPESGSTTLMAWYEGRRSIWLEIQKELDIEDTEIIRESEIVERHNESVTNRGVFGEGEL